MPSRIQRKRSKNWRTPPNCLYVGRPTVYGNPYKVVHAFGKWYNVEWEKWGQLYRSPPMTEDEAIEEALRLYREHVGTKLRRNPEWLEPLRGKDLSCWCPLTQKCHVDVILELMY